MQHKGKGGDTAFGRHESFPLRFGWITKGLDAIKEDPSVFSREDASVTLGVGKNMVASIRYWLHATRIVDRSPTNNALRPTQLGEIAFGKSGDRYLEDDGTIWLLHWSLATNDQNATAIYWFFNHFHKSAFSGAEVGAALTEFVKRELSLRVAATTLKRDAQLVLRMYSMTSANARLMPEDDLDSPLAMLGLQERIDSRNWRTVPTERAELPLDVFGFAIAETFGRQNINQIAVRDLMYSSAHHCAPGAVFRMTEEGLIGKLETLCDARADALHLNRTAGVFQLYKTGGFDALSILKDRYAFSDRQAA